MILMNNTVWGQLFTQLFYLLTWLKFHYIWQVFLVNMLSLWLATNQISVSSFCLTVASLFSTLGRTVHISNKRIVSIKRFQLCSSGWVQNCRLAITVPHFKELGRYCPSAFSVAAGKFYAILCLPYV